METAAFPQDYAAAMTVYRKIAEYSKVVTVDIGGFTLDYLLIREGKPDLSVCDSLEKGVIRLYNDIASRVNSEQDILIGDTDIDRIIRGERTDFHREVVRIVEDMTRIYVNDILGTLRERGLRNRDVICRLQLRGIDICSGTYSKVETGKANPAVDMIMALAQVYQCGYGEFFRE